MKKTLFIILAGLPVLFAQGPRGGFGGGRGAGMFGGPESYVTGAPYSAVQVVQTQEAFADGNTINTKRQTNVFRDGQGRVRTEETITPVAGSGKQPYTIVTILDYVGGFRYQLDSSTMKAHQSPLRTPRQGSGSPSVGTTAGPLARGPRPGGPGGPETPAEATAGFATVTRTALAPQAVNGLMATGTHHLQTIAAQKIGNERPIQISRTMWISNDLKVPVQIKSSDPRFGTTSMDLTNIVQSEPSPSLFMVPGGYTVESNGRGFGGSGGGQRGPRPAHQ